MRNVFLDFDGTLVDVSAKYYSLYSLFVRQYNGIPLTREEYWRLKRRNIKNEELCRKSKISTELGIQLKEYTKEKIEDHEYLNQDILLNGVKETLRILKEALIFRLILISMRRNYSNFVSQVASFGLDLFFDQIVSPFHILPNIREGDSLSKSCAIEELGLTNSEGIIIGDSGMDIHSGRRLGFVTIAVLTGIRNEELLAKYGPQHIVNSLPDVINLIQ